MNAEVKKIIVEAKRYLIAAWMRRAGLAKSEIDVEALRDEKFGFEEILVALAALRDDTAILPAVAKILGVKSVTWPPSLVEEAKLAATVDADQAAALTLGLQADFDKAYLAIKEPDGVSRLDTFLEAVLTWPQARNSNRVNELWMANQEQSKKRKRSGTLGQLDEIEARRSKLESILAEKVVGQEEAIRMVGENYVRSLREQQAKDQPSSKGLRGVMTFFGPSGVGKTMLAKEFARALGQVERASGGKGYEYYLFNEEKTSLPQRIKANPRQVLIFDDFLAMKPDQQVALSGILREGAIFREVSTGQATRSEFVSLAECFVIFITDVGKHILDSPNIAGIIRDGRISSEQFFDLLARQIRITTDLFEQPTTGDFLDYLRQGTVVFFNNLTIADYSGLLQQAFAGVQDSEKAKNYLPKVRASSRATRLMIMSLLPDLSAEKVAAETKSLRHLWADKVVRSRLPELEKSGAESFILSVNDHLDAKSSELIDGFLGKRPVSLMVIDNDHRMANFIENYVASQPGELSVRVQRVENPKVALEEIMQNRPDVVLLDLDLPAEQLPGGDIKVLHRQIRETMPGVPLWLFGEAEGEELDINDFVETGGARGYFAFRQDAQDLVIRDTQRKRFEELLEEVAFDRVMAELSRSRTRLVPVYEIVDCPPRAKEPTLEVRITRIRSEQSLFLIAGDISPAGIPDDRFSDVFGCDRAKERLIAAIAMIKGQGPAKLARFGERAPTGYLLAGPPGTGKTLLARAAAGEAGCNFFPLSAGELESSHVGAGEARIRNLFEDARRVSPSIIFIDEIDSIAAERKEHSSEHSIKMLNQLLVCMDGFSKAQSEVLVLAATNRPEKLDKAIKRAGRFDETIAVDLPDADVREKFFRKLLAKKPCDPNVDDFIPELVSQTGGLSPAELRRILREAVYRAFQAERETLTREDLEKSLILVRSGISTGRIAPAERPLVTFDDVFGLERAKDRLKEAVKMLEKPDLLAKFHERPPSGYLLAGPPGTGKTHLARATANAAKGYFFSLSAGDLESKWIGESEERIRQLFQEARQYTPAVIFIDEIDAIAGRRDKQNSEHSGKVLNQLLTCMDGFADTKGQVLVLAATNRPDALDPAITRPGRFDEIIPIEAPGEKAREQMLRQLLAKKPCEADVFEYIPRLMGRTAGMSPAQLDRVIREAVYLASRQERDKLSLVDLETAANHVRYGAERHDMQITEEDRQRTAWHEAGHAVARLVLFPSEELDLITVVPNERGALGFAAWRAAESRHSHSAQDYRNLIVVALAGREAELHCPVAKIDSVNTGVSSDYERATALAWDYVTRFGFDENFGVFCTASLPPTVEAALASPIYERVQELLANCLEDCRKLMLKEMPRIEALAKALCSKQTLYGEEAKQIFTAN